MISEPAVRVQNLSHHYGAHLALDDVSFDVTTGEVFGFLGPNGSGKTTLFRILSTLIPPGAGSVQILGSDARANRDAVRKMLGVVFQSPSLDRMLTARENLMHQGHLYGLRGSDLQARIEQSLSRVKLLERGNERLGSFSGGMRRRVELAKGMLTSPRVLILDEPSTGLDPGARIDLWNDLRQLQSEGMTILLTTHLMDEADRCSRVAILNHGKIAVCDSPAALKDRIGGDVITLQSDDPPALLSAMREKLSLDAELLDGAVRLERRDGHQLVPQLIEALPGMIKSVSVGKPTLEDVFIQVTGKSFRDEEQTAYAGSKPPPPHG